MTVQDPPSVPRRNQRIRRRIFVVLGVLTAAILLAQFVVFPWIVRKAVNQALAQAGVRDVRFTVSRATAWGSELTDVTIGDGTIGTIGTIDRVRLNYSAGDLWNGKLQAIRIIGADVTLNVRDGSIDFGAFDSMVTTRPVAKRQATAASTLPVGRIELSDSKVTFVTPKQSVEVPIAGSVVRQSDGHLSLGAQVGQENAMTIGAELREGKLTFAGSADPGRTLVIVRHIWPEADVSVDGKLKLTGHADKATGSARLEIDRSFVTANRPAKLHLSRGVFEVDAIFSEGEFSVTVQVQNAAIALAGEGFSAEGLNGELAVRGFSPLMTAPNQKLVAESMRIGDMELTDGIFEFQMLDRDKIHVNHTAWNWLGGKVWVEDFTLASGAPIEVTLNAEDIDLKDLLSNFAKDKATGEGRVSGQLPIIIHDSHVHFGDGKITALKGGDVQIKDMAAIAPTAEAAARAASGSASDEIKKNVIEALANFQYDTLSAELVNEEGGLVGKVRMRGKGRTGAKQPLNYELNVHGIDKGLRAYLRVPGPATDDAAFQSCDAIHQQRFARRRNPMTTRRTFITLIIALFLAPAFSFGVTKDELQKRFKERYPELRKLKDAGTIGETDGGFVEVVTGGDADARKIVAAENADRNELYALIAKSEGVSADEVAKQNAQRNFDRARPGDMLKIDGKWSKKA